MVTSDLEKFPMNGREPGRLRMIVKGSFHSLPTTVFSDVTFGVVTRGKQELRGFAKRAFAAVPDLKYELRSWFARGQWAAIDWVMSGTHKGDFPHVRADELGPSCHQILHQ